LAAGVGLGGVVPALDATAGDAPLEGRPPTVSLTPPKMPRPGRRKPAGSSYCLLKRLSIRANNVTSSRRAYFAARFTVVKPGALM
jgi:hypothetical protein